MKNSKVVKPVTNETLKRFVKITLVKSLNIAPKNLSIEHSYKLNKPVISIKDFTPTPEQKNVIEKGEEFLKTILK